MLRDYAPGAKWWRAVAAIGAAVCLFLCVPVLWPLLAKLAAGKIVGDTAIGALLGLIVALVKRYARNPVFRHPVVVRNFVLWPIAGAVLVLVLVTLPNRLFVAGDVQGLLTLGRALCLVPAVRLLADAIAGPAPRYTPWGTALTDTSAPVALPMLDGEPFDPGILRPALPKREDAAAEAADRGKEHRRRSSGGGSHLEVVKDEEAADQDIEPPRRNRAGS